MSFSNPVSSAITDALIHVWYIVPLLIIVVLFNGRRIKGAIGEGAVNLLLSRLQEPDYVLIKNITLPTEGGTTQIDHVVVSRFGLFVIETKNMKGWIYGSSDKKVWTQKIYRHKSTFQNPLHQNYKHTKALEAALRCNPSQIYSLVVFIGSCTFKTTMPDNVTYASGCLDYIRRFTVPVFTDAEVRNIISLLHDIKLQPSFTTDRNHRRHVRDITANKAVVNSSNTGSHKACPSCGSVMLLKEAKRGSNLGQKFWGCSTFPKCRATSKGN